MVFIGMSFEDTEEEVSQTIAKDTEEYYTRSDISIIMEMNLIERKKTPSGIKE